MKQPLSFDSPEREAARQTRSLCLDVNRLVSRQGGIIDISFCLSTGREKFFKARLAEAVGGQIPFQVGLKTGIRPGANCRQLFASVQLNVVVIALHDDPAADLRDGRS